MREEQGGSNEKAFIPFILTYNIMKSTGMHQWTSSGFKFPTSEVGRTIGVHSPRPLYNPTTCSFIMQQHSVQLLHSLIQSRIITHNC